MKRDYLEEAKLKKTKVWLTPENKVKFDDGEIVIGYLFGQGVQGLIELEVRASQCNAVFRNGKPYVKNTDWTWNEINNFKDF